MATVSVSLVRCPELVCAGCGGQTVRATYSARNVSVEPCQSLREQGWQGDVQVVLWHNQALQYLTPVRGAQ